jgi:cell fate (sporulation/competence/biofilm development) regulator YlbF (YheA/YmcA/DUF963 family)
MRIDDKVERALAAADSFEQFRALVLELRADGHSSSAILDQFERVRQHLRQAGREADEDALLEVMDCLVGWCSPHVNLSDSASAPSDGGS